MDAMTARADDLPPKDKQELKAAAKELVSEFALWLSGDSLLSMERKRLRCVSAGDKAGEKYITEKMHKEKEYLIHRARQMGKTTQFINEMLEIFKGIPPEPPTDDEIAAKCIEMVRNPLAIEMISLPGKPLGPY